MLEYRAQYYKVQVASRESRLPCRVDVCMRTTIPTYILYTTYY
jgi:hypothetical protein